MLSCFDNLIGIKNGCTAETPSSNLYVNDLPGISLEIADSAMTDEDRDAIEFIQKRIDYASEKIKQDFRSFLKPRMRANSIMEQDTIGIYDDNLQTESAEAGKYKGIFIEVDSANYLSIFLSSIKLKIDTSGTFNILVINLMTGKIQDTLPITTVADESTELVINKEYPIVRQKLQLLVCIDSSIADSYHTDINYSGNSSGCKSCGGSSKRVTRFSAMEIDSGGTLIKSNLDSINHTNGLSLNYSLRCSLDPYICTYAVELAYPLWQKTGAEILTELMYSKNINSVVNIYATEHAELRDEFEANYANSMNQILDNIGVVNDWCFKCTPAIKDRVQLP